MASDDETIFNPHNLPLTGDLPLMGEGVDAKNKP